MYTTFKKRVSGWLDGIEGIIPAILAFLLCSALVYGLGLVFLLLFAAAGHASEWLLRIVAPFLGV